MNIFQEPAKPFIMFNYCDFAILLLVNILVFCILKYNLLKYNRIFKIVILLSFGIIIPVISTEIEAANVHRKFDFVEGFNLVYIFLKYPVWWVIGISNSLLFAKYVSYQNKKNLN